MTFLYNNQEFYKTTKQSCQTVTQCRFSFKDQFIFIMLKRTYLWNRSNSLELLKMEVPCKKNLIVIAFYHWVKQSYFIICALDTTLNYRVRMQMHHLACWRYLHYFLFYPPGSFKMFHVCTKVQPHRPNIVQGLLMDGITITRQTHYSTSFISEFLYSHTRLSQ